MNLERNSPEWFTAWSKLKERTKDVSGAAPCPDCGEEWEFMGQEEWESRQVYVFRHRHHPVTGARRYEHIPVEEVVRS